MRTEPNPTPFTNRNDLEPTLGTKDQDTRHLIVHDLHRRQQEFG